MDKYAETHGTIEDCLVMKKNGCAYTLLHRGSEKGRNCMTSPLICGILKKKKTKLIKTESNGGCQGLGAGASGEMLLRVDF